MNRLLLALVITSVSVLAQINTTLTPTPKQQFLDNNADPLNGGFVYTYAAGTTTPQATYTDSTGAIQNTNPVVLDAAGRAAIWLGSLPYKVVLKSSAGVMIWSIDNVTDLAQALKRNLASSSGSSLIGTIQGGTGAKLRTQQQKNNDIVNVADYGAACDGVTDDSVSIQNAINYVNASSGSGGTVMFPVTIHPCMIKKTIWVTRGVNLVGSSQSGSAIQALPGGTWSTYADNGFAEPGKTCVANGGHNCSYMIGMSFGVNDYSHEVHFASIQNLQIYANSLVDTSIFVPNMQENSFIRNCLINGYQTYGIWMGGQNPEEISGLYMFPGSSATAVDIHMSFNTASRIHLKGITCDGFGETCIDINANYGIHVEDVHAEHRTNGIYAFNNGGGIIENVYGNPTTAITIRLGKNTTDTNSYILRSIFSGNAGTQLTLCDLNAPAYGSGTCAGFTGVAAIPGEILEFRLFDKAAGIMITDSGEAQFVGKMAINNTLTLGSTANFVNSGVPTFTLDAARNIIAAGQGGGTTTGLLFTSYPQYNANPNFTNGGGNLVGYCQNSPSCFLLAGGSTSDGSTFTARATSASHVIDVNGVIQFAADTGLTIGNTYGPTIREQIDGGGVQPQVLSFSSLPAVPTAGHMLYCANCTTAATCTSGGSGHMAVSNGANWTCQ